MWDFVGTYLTLITLDYNSQSLALPPHTAVHGSLQHALGLEPSASVVKARSLFFSFFWNQPTRTTNCVPIDLQLLLLLLPNQLARTTNCVPIDLQLLLLLLLEPTD
jgi:hypothetical protein